MVITMAEMTTTLVKFSSQGNSTTFTAPGHTVQKPRLILQKRKIPGTNPNAVAETSNRVIYGAEDGAAVVMGPRITFECVSRVPVSASASDISAAKAVFRDFVASAAFDRAVDGQLFIG